jgi:hypothetical protein
MLSSELVKTGILCFLSLLTSYPSYAGPPSSDAEIKTTGLMRAIPDILASSQYAHAAGMSGLSQDATSSAQTAPPVPIMGGIGTPPPDYQPATPPTPQIHPKPPDMPARPANYKVHPLTDANDRVEVVLPTSAIPLAQSYNLGLKIKGRGLTVVDVMQRVPIEFGGRSTWDVVEEAGQKKSQLLQVVYRADGEAYIKILPLRLGRVEFLIKGVFPDGGVLQQTLHIYVEEPIAPPTRLMVGSGFLSHGDQPIVTLSLGRSYQLSPNAIYDGIEDPIRIDPSLVRFSVRTEGNREIIQVDSLTGKVTGLNLGHALVETSYRGLTTPVCLIVVDGPSRIYDSTTSHCEELLAPGEKLRDDVILPLRP